MGDNKNSVSCIEHEDEMAKAERTNERLYVATLVLLVALAASNAAWIYTFLK